MPTAVILGSHNECRVDQNLYGYNSCGRLNCLTSRPEHKLAQTDQKFISCLCNNSPKQMLGEEKNSPVFDD